jgi:hypothetical protein
VEKIEFDVRPERRGQWINAQFASISAGRAFQPTQFMRNLCRSSARCNRLLNGDLSPSRVSLDGSDRRAAFGPSSRVVDNAILEALDQTPFASMHELAKVT